LITGIYKLQISNSKFQTNSNDQNPNFQTYETLRSKRPVSVIEYLNLRFICNLVLGIWNFWGRKMIINC
jgi:hypothetical protein